MSLYLLWRCIRYNKKKGYRGSGGYRGIITEEGMDTVTYFGGNQRSRVWKLKKVYLPHTRTSWDKFMFNRIVFFKFWDRSELVRLRGKIYCTKYTMCIVRDVVQKYNTAKGGTRVEKYIIARGGHRTRQERIIWWGRRRQRCCKTPPASVSPFHFLIVNFPKCIHKYLESEDRV